MEMLREPRGALKRLTLCEMLVGGIAGHDAASLALRKNNCSYMMRRRPPPVNGPVFPHPMESLIILHNHQILN